jgi:hypothetical protein
MGGPGNSLGRNYHYSIEVDVNVIAERTVNINLGFINVFKRHGKPWMNGKVRLANLRLDRSLMGCGMSHIGITDTASYFMACTIILEAKGGLRILLLKEYFVIMRKIWSVFLLLSMLEPLLFFSLNAIGQGCLTYIECSHVCSIFHGKNRDHLNLSNLLNIFHRNFRGPRSKSDELTNCFEIYSKNPQILC